MKRLAMIVTALSLVATLAGCASIRDDAPAASPDFRDDRLVPQATRQAP